MTAWGTSTAWGSSQSFGAPAQNFGTPTTAWGAPSFGTYSGVYSASNPPPTTNGSPWGTHGNPQWTPNNERTAPLYDANGIAARSDSQRYCYGPDGWGPHLDQPQPSTATKPSSSTEWYKSPNEWLDAPRITSIINFSREGFALHAVDGRPVCPEWVHAMALTYPERTWEELCQAGPMPLPKAKLGAFERHWSHAPPPASTSTYQAEPVRSFVAKPAPVPAPAPAPAPEGEAYDRVASRVAEKVKAGVSRATESARDFAENVSRTTQEAARKVKIGAEDAAFSLEQHNKIRGACERENARAAKKCLEDLGWISTNEAGDLAKRAVVGKMTNGTKALFIDKAANYVEQLVKTPSCRHAIKVNSTHACMERVMGGDKILPRIDTYIPPKKKK